MPILGGFVERLAAIPLVVPQGSWGAGGTGRPGVFTPATSRRLRSLAAWSSRWRENGGGLATAVRWCSLSLVGMDVATAPTSLHLLGATVVLVAYTGVRTAIPIRPRGRAGTVYAAIVAEVALCVAAVVYSGGWDSPLIFMLGAALLIAGLVRGFPGVAAGLGVLVPGSFVWLASARVGFGAGILAERLAAIAVVGGLGAYARTLSELDRRRTVAEERGRIARDLHDGLGQSVVAIGLELDLLASRWAGGDTAGLVELNRALQQLARGLHAINHQVRGELSRLRSDPGVRSALVAAVEELLGGVERRSNIATEFVHHETGAISSGVEDELWMIAKEAIANAERHSGASRISVGWTLTSDEAALEVVDDGRGLAKSSDGRFGIIGMHERAALLGAKLRISAVEPRGTLVELRLRKVDR